MLLQLNILLVLKFLLEAGLLSLLLREELLGLLQFLVLRFSLLTKFVFLLLGFRQ